MKLVSYSMKSSDSDVRTGLLVDNAVIDLNLAYVCYLSENSAKNIAYQEANKFMPTEMIALFKTGSLYNETLKRVRDFVCKNLANGNVMRAPEDESVIYQLDEVKLMAPVLRPNSIRDTISFEGHMKNFEKRTKKPIPQLWYKIPVYYKGNPSTVIGHDASVEWPHYTEKLDYELEFGIYVGKEGKNIRAEEADEYIAGYTIFNDFSARDILQDEVSMFLGPAKGKDFDTGNSMGPYLVSTDELDVRDLKMVARINGEVWSEGNSSDMYWGFPKIIEYISQSETLYPGDFIGSGTVANGCGDELDRWIRPGDMIELEVEGIGTLRNWITRDKFSNDQ